MSLSSKNGARLQRGPCDPAPEAEAKVHQWAGLCLTQPVQSDLRRGRGGREKEIGGGGGGLGWLTMASPLTP